MQGSIFCYLTLFWFLLFSCLSCRNQTSFQGIDLCLLDGYFMILLVVQLLSCVRLFVTPWTAARQVSLSFTVFQSLLKFLLLCWWCHLIILSFSSCLQSFPASESFLMSWPFASLWFCFLIFHLSAVSDGPRCYQKGADSTRMMHNSDYVF